jgi:hypothetical protein
MSMVFDEYGRPFIILREQKAKERVRGIEAQKVRIVYTSNKYIIYLFGQLMYSFSHTLLQLVQWLIL